MPHYCQAKKQMNYNLDMWPNHPLYIYNFFYNKPSFIIKNEIEIVQPRASFMITYIIQSSKTIIYKTIPIVNKAPLSKLISYLIYISPNPTETWSISFAKSSTSSSIVLRPLLMCGCSSTTICHWNLFSMTTIINKQNLRQSAKPIQSWLVGHFTLNTKAN